MFAEIESLNVKVLKSHKIALKNLARLEGEPMSVVLRGLIRNEAQKRGVWPPLSQENKPNFEGVRDGS